MQGRVWWKQLHWFEYGAELLGTAFLLFAGVSTVVFDFGAGSPLATALPTEKWMCSQNALHRRHERNI